MLGRVDVVNTARSSLSDDGRSDWDNESEGFLHRNYPGWQYPTGTTMVPSAFPLKMHADSGGAAEKKIFDLLENFGKKFPEPMFVVHSHKFNELVECFGKGAPTGNKKWLNGEHDFVLIHHDIGPIFMQVKASCKTRKQYGEAKEQLDKDKRATVNFLKRVLGQNKPVKEAAGAMFKFPGFVVMPNCPRPKNAEQTGLFLEDCEDVDTFASWWQAHVKGCATAGVSQQIFEHLIKRFVGLIHCRASLSCDIDKTSDGLNFFTQQQLRTWEDVCHKQWIFGPAGSGKTLLIQMKVIDLAARSLAREDNSDEENKILVLCFNRPLCESLKNVFSTKLKDLLQGEELCSVIDVMTYNEFLCSVLGASRKHFIDDSTKRRFVAETYRKLRTQKAAPKCHYKHIFVDEGQDLYGENWPEVLGFHLQPDEDDDEMSLGLQDRQYMWVLYDSNQHVQPSADDFRSFRQHLRNSSQLTFVKRNTSKIFDLSKKFFSSAYFREPKLGHDIVGHDVVWDDSLPEELKEEEGPKLLAKHVHQLQKGGVKYCDICVLTAEVNTRDQLIKELEKNGIPCQNAEENIKTQRSAIIVESVRRFKGLEAKVVILFDLVNQHTSTDVNNLLYIAISRCNCLLVVLTTKVGCALIKGNQLGKLLRSMDVAGRKRGLDMHYADRNADGKRSTPFE